MNASASLPGFVEAFWDAIRRRYTRDHGGAKALAQDSGAPLSTAKKWLQRSSVAQGEPLLRILLASPDVNDALLETVKARIAHTQNRRRVLHERTQAAAVVAHEDGGAGGQPGGVVADGRGVVDQGGVAVAVTVDRRVAR